MHVNVYSDPVVQDPIIMKEHFMPKAFYYIDFITTARKSDKTLRPEYKQLPGDL